MKKTIIFAAAICGIILLAAVFTCMRLSKGVKQEPPSRSPYSPLVTQAQELEAQGNFIQAKEIYQKLMSEFTNSPEMSSWQKNNEDLNIKLLFSPAVTLNSRIYEIKPGDSLEKIAREFKTTVELIMKSNSLPDNKIMPGKKIKVWTAPFNIVVDKSQNILYLKVKEDIFKTYIVATGANNSTPVGTFTIVNKIANPPWFKAGKVIPPGSPENILGTRWLGIDKKSYGIHGTTAPESIGTQATQGCVRMLNSEVEELFTIVPVGTEVTIVD